MRAGLYKNVERDSETLVRVPRSLIGICLAFSAWLGSGRSPLVGFGLFCVPSNRPPEVRNPDLLRLRIRATFHTGGHFESSFCVSVPCED